MLKFQFIDPMNILLIMVTRNPIEHVSEVHAYWLYYTSYSLELWNEQLKYFRMFAFVQETMSNNYGIQKPNRYSLMTFWFSFYRVHYNYI